MQQYEDKSSFRKSITDDALVMDSMRLLESSNSSRETIFKFEDEDEEEEKDFYRELSDVEEQSKYQRDIWEVWKIDDTSKYDNDNQEDFSSSIENENIEEEEKVNWKRVRAARKDVTDEESCSDGEDEYDETYVDVLADIPTEILRDRQGIIEKLGEFRKLYPELMRKNNLLENWVVKTMRKKHQIMTPEQHESSQKILISSDDNYMKKLILWKFTIDEIEARQNNIKLQVENMKNNVEILVNEDKSTHSEFVEREREIASGLIFANSGRIISAKTIDTIIRRQIVRRDLLNSNRYGYIYHRNLYDDVKIKLRLVEKLGDEGITLMNYEELRLVNYSYKDKLEERETKLEEFYIKVQELLNILSHYKEKVIANQADINNEKCHLEIIRSKVQSTRYVKNKNRHELSKIRQICVNQKLRGGMLFAIPVIREMENTLETVKNLKDEIKEMLLVTHHNYSQDLNEKKL